VWANEVEVQPDIEDIRQKAEAEPNNLDIWYSLAEQSSKKGMFAQAAKAFEHMLEVDPSLQKIKLDLSLVYGKLNRTEEAIRLLNEVKAANPPKEVADNIDKVLKALEDKQKKGGLKISLMAGYNYDTNANSASGNGQVLFNNITIPLEDASRAQRDHQFVNAATMGYDLDLPQILAGRVQTKWMNSATAYQTVQQDLTSLNLRLFSGSSGFEFSVPELATSVKTTGTYSYITLDGHSYLNTPTASINGTTQISDKVAITEGMTWEWRRFEDDAKDRTGIGEQANLGLNYQFSPQDMANISTLLRKENTRKEYYDNKQYGFNAGWTHIFDETTFANLGAGLKWSKYDGPDSFVSPTTLRKDKEKTFNFTVGKKLMEDFTGTVGYQFRNVESNIINYDYNNHRGMATINWEY
jgi:tetratricopeptide (TPR) repeat protein